jgi:hypothetical protein
MLSSGAVSDFRAVTLLPDMPVKLPAAMLTAEGYDFDAVRGSLLMRDRPQGQPSQARRLRQSPLSSKQAG